MTPADVEQQIKLAGCTTEQYFNRAMKWRYGEFHDTMIDVIKYDIHYIVAPYVISYTLHLQQAAIRKEEDETTCDDCHLIDVAKGE